MIIDQNPKLRRLVAPILKRFSTDDQGAVTVDWVALTAAIVLLGVSVMFYATSSVPEVANSLSRYMDGVTVVPN